MAHKGTTKFIVTFHREAAGCGDPECCGPNPEPEVKRFNSRSELAAALREWRGLGNLYSYADIQQLNWNTLPPHLL